MWSIKHKPIKTFHPALEYGKQRYYPMLSSGSLTKIDLFHKGEPPDVV